MINWWLPDIEKRRLIPERVRRIEIMNKKRIIAVIIDFAIVCAIQTILMLLFLIRPLIAGGVITFNVLTRQLAITFCSLFYLIIRDVIGKKSIGKRIMKLKIVNKNNGEDANFIKRIVRNITWLLNWIEIIVFLAAKERIGDRIAGTMVVEQGEPHSPVPI